MNVHRLQQLLCAFATKRLAVIGDIMLDEFIWGRVCRVSPEAPVPVVEVQSESHYPGGAANVARNLKPFCQSVHIFGLLGRDPSGDRLARLLRNEGILTGYLVRGENFSTVLKTRIIALHQQVVRVDRENKGFFSAADTKTTSEQVLKIFKQLLPSLDGVIFEDYGKGFLNQELKDRLCHMANGKGMIVAADPSSSNPLDWSGVTVIKPNRSEVFDFAGVPSSLVNVSNPLEDKKLLQACERLQARWDLPQLLITLGEQGMLLVQPGSLPYYIPTRAKEVFDVSGAGDTTIAIYTLALCANAAPEEAAEISNHAAGIVVGKLGTATLTREELEGSFE
ncbi:MAG: hypothetical protein JMM76_03485 [Candidatus Xiphinematobacter sp.]|nr:MAG: hypothetical protein JMM79_03560 [Candidatus Xiphinematobacter sp.]QQY09038.1 MAG: hypothetical protein JMM76_03485 [Candidatus Xiphinematobacter sp.]QQY09778.1 MAG: hypothetical protein JMM78_03575 [Candidatus Xiphinematobacter sp.]QQY10521.1 MAG: hypothetical protein JMM74_03465 [Candidatus Xiphinematobacter sp.]QQY11258.1 MAG: hypothetical protein JMM77_03540 [Candidatus Xiphinematobacter sp.]